MRDETTLALRPDLFGQLAATDPFQGRARRLYERGQVLVVNGNQADVRVGYDARSNPLDLKEVPILSGYIPRVGDWVAIQYEAGHSGAPWVAGPSMAADESEDTPGIGVFSVSSEQPADPQKSTVYFDEPASTWRGWNGAAWVDLGGGGGGLHNSLPDLQGGASGEYYHLTAAQWNALAGNTPFGAGGVVYADGSGRLATDAAFAYDATNKTVGIGAAPDTSHRVRTDGAYHHLHTRTDRHSWETIITTSFGGGFGWRDADAGLYRLFLNEAGQVLVGDGSADSPAISWLSETGMGFYRWQAGAMIWQQGGFPRMTFGPGWYLSIGNFADATAADLWLRTKSGYDAMVHAMEASEAYGFSWGYKGDANDWILRRHENDESGVVVLRAYRAKNVMCLEPDATPSLTAEGDHAMDSTQKTFRWRMGTMQCLGASLLDTARVSDATVSDSGGELAEQAISTCTIESGFNTSGNAVKVVAKGTARVNPKGEGGGASMHILFRIEGTNVLDLAFNAAEAQPATWIHYEFSFNATMRGSTSWEISNVKAEHATWQQVGNPWPCIFTPTLRRYGRDTAFTVSGDVTTQVRCSISNGAPGGSYITVAKHQAGLEQT